MGKTHLILGLILLKMAKWQALETSVIINSVETSVIINKLVFIDIH